MKKYFEAGGRKKLPCLFLLWGVSLILPFGCSGGGSGSGSGSGTFQSGPQPQLALVSFVSGLTAPVGLEAPNDGTSRLFVVQQGGTIRIIHNGSLLPAAFLNITAKVESGGEEGLLGLAFHPNFGITNRRFFVNYTRRVGLQLQTVISEFAASATDPNLADLLSERVLLVVNQPFDNHNGGQLAFGPDGFLYIGLGDGGSGGDPQGNGQSLATFLGKILRIDVDSSPASGKAYAIPFNNPFIGGSVPEIWAFGLRNPWRFSFDTPTGRLFAGDVGQDSFEEVNLITRGGNFGWKTMEGNHCFSPSTGCNMTGLILPITEYPHDATGGTAIIGGFFYRGANIPALVGTYIFGDLSSGHIWSLREDALGTWQRTLILTHNLTVSAFGRDTAGELYLVDYGNGAILRVQAGT